MKHLEEEKLFEAVHQNNLEQVSKLLSNGVYVNAHDEEGWTPLMGVALHGNLNTFNILLDNGANIKLRTACGDGIDKFALVGGNDDIRRIVEAKWFERNKVLNEVSVTQRLKGLQQKPSR